MCGINANLGWKTTEQSKGATEREQTQKKKMILKAISDHADGWKILWPLQCET